jgi:CRP/FNR family transcriptional regulator, cyclic AMP receptor protein
MSFLTVKGRVARALLDLADHFGTADRTGHVIFRQRTGHREIAATAGVKPENVSPNLE